MVALVLSLSCALGASACVQEHDASSDEAQEPRDTGANEGIDATVEGPTATTGQAVEENCLQACMDAYDRMLIYCQGLDTLKAKALCRAAATAALSVCIARCPD
jgi:hypothetical protein